MRLIDADALIEDYKKELEKVDFEKLSDNDKLIIATSAKALIDFTKRQPIAYDIDKVVEELREWSANVTILELHNNELGEYEEECKRDVICTLNAIDIVEQGVR